MKRSLTTYNATNWKIYSRPWYLNSYGATFVVHTSDKADASCGYASDKAFLSNRSIEDMLLNALAFYPLSSVFNYIEQLQQAHKAPTLYIIFTYNDYFQSERLC